MLEKTCLTGNYAKNLHLQTAVQSGYDVTLDVMTSTGICTGSERTHQRELVSLHPLEGIGGK